MKFLRALIGLGIDGIADPADGLPTIDPTAFTPRRIMLPGVLIVPIARRSANVGTSGSTTTAGSFPVTLKGDRYLQPEGEPDVEVHSDVLAHVKPTVAGDRVIWRLRKQIMRREPRPHLLKAHAG
jgi:hypothetical protein